MSPYSYAARVRSRAAAAVPPPAAAAGAVAAAVPGAVVPPGSPALSVSASGSVLISVGVASTSPVHAGVCAADGPVAAARADGGGDAAVDVRDGPDPATRIPAATAATTTILLSRFLSLPRNMLTRRSIGTGQHGLSSWTGDDAQAGPRPGLQFIPGDQNLRTALRDRAIDVVRAR